MPDITHLDFAAFQTVVTSLQTASAILSGDMEALLKLQQAASVNYRGLAAESYCAQADAALRKGRGLTTLVGVAAELLQSIVQRIAEVDATLGHAPTGQVQIALADGSLPAVDVGAYTQTGTTGGVIVSLTMSVAYTEGGALAGYSATGSAVLLGGSPTP